MITSVVLGLWLLAVQDRQVADPTAELAAARSLYAAAAYEDALEKLSRIGGENVRDQVDTYKALCLLALGRTRESEKVIEQILTRNPQYLPDEKEVSPRLVAAYRTVRARLLPTAARNMYAAARASYDEKKYELAAAQLRELLTLLNSEEPDTMLADLKLLAEDYLRLAESTSETPTPPNVAILCISRVTVPKGPIYSSLDKTAIAPVEISRPVPIWEAPRGTAPGLYQGVVEIVIDEQGRVESACVRQSIAQAFDAEVLAYTDKWRFQPASKGGVPVKYRRSYEVIGHSR